MSCTERTDLLGNVPEIPGHCGRWGCLGGLGQGGIRATEIAKGNWEEDKVPLLLFQNVLKGQSGVRTGGPLLPFPPALAPTPLPVLLIPLSSATLRLPSGLGIRAVMSA